MKLLPEQARLLHAARQAGRRLEVEPLLTPAGIKLDAILATSEGIEYRRFALLDSDKGACRPMTFDSAAKMTLWVNNVLGVTIRPAVEDCPDRHRVVA